MARWQAEKNGVNRTGSRDDALPSADPVSPRIGRQKSHRRHPSNPGRFKPSLLKIRGDIRLRSANHGWRRRHCWGLWVSYCVSQCAD